MPREAATSPSEPLLPDHIGVGVLARRIPLDKVKSVLAATGKTSVRERQMPAHVAVYYVVALALHFGTGCCEVFRILQNALTWIHERRRTPVTITDGGISLARERLGEEPLKLLHDELVAPVAVPESKGAWFRRRRVVSLDGLLLDVPDTTANADAFGRPGASKGRAGYPQVRLVSLAECGTHVLFGSRLGGCRTGEVTLAREVVEHLRPDMLCLADRNFFGYTLWKRARDTGAELLWRVKVGRRLPVERRLADGSYLSRIYASETDREKKLGAMRVRVVEYTLAGVSNAEPHYRLVTTLLDPKEAPAIELAALYAERWEIEIAFGEVKTRLKGANRVLRSKRPELVRQEVWGLLLAHWAVRGIMHEAALSAGRDPDTVSFTHAVHVVRQNLPVLADTPP